MNKSLQLMWLCLIAGSAIAADAPAPPVFQMRVVLDGPTDETEPMVLVQTSKDATSKPQTLQVKKTVLLDQTAIQSAFAYVDKFSGNSRIRITFTEAGKAQFSNVTRDCIRKRLAIVINGRLYSAPMIHEQISGGEAEVSGSFNEQEALALAAKITVALGKR